MPSADVSFQDDLSSAVGSGNGGSRTPHRDTELARAVRLMEVVQQRSMVPIRAVDPIGAIGVYSSERHEAISTELRLVQALADSTAVALESARLWEGLEDRIAAGTAEPGQTNRELAKRVAGRDEARARATHLAATDHTTVPTDRVVRAARGVGADTPGLRAPLCLSIGAASGPTNHSGWLDELLNRADQAMYDGRRAARRCAEEAQEPADA